MQYVDGKLLALAVHRNSSFQDRYEKSLTFWSCELRWLLAVTAAEAVEPL